MRGYALVADLRAEQALKDTREEAAKVERVSVVSSRCAEMRVAAADRLVDNVQSAWAEREATVKEPLGFGGGGGNRCVRLSWWCGGGKAVV